MKEFDTLNKIVIGEIELAYLFVVIAHVVDPPECLRDVLSIDQVLQHVEVLQVGHVWLDCVLGQEVVLVFHLQLDL